MLYLSQPYGLSNGGNYILMPTDRLAHGKIPENNRSNNRFVTFFTYVAFFT